MHLRHQVNLKRIMIWIAVIAVVLAHWLNATEIADRLGNGAPIESFLKTYVLLGSVYFAIRLLRKYFERDT